jgi:uncharacterized glyoxalase superfamily protein PhnB
MSVKPIPDGARTLTPHLTCAGAADAIEFYRRAFGARQQFRLDAPDGKVMHACVRIGDSDLFLNDEAPEWGALGPKSTQGTPVTIHLYVEDADATAARAVEAGAKMIMPVAEQFWGDRYGVVEDPFGHRWSLATHVRDVSPDDLKNAMARHAGCPDA